MRLVVCSSDQVWSREEALGTFSLANNVSQGVCSSEPGPSRSAQNMLYVVLGHLFYLIC